MDARAARILDLHYYLGLSANEIGDLTAMEPPAVYQEMRAAKAWLKRHLMGR